MTIFQLKLLAAVLMVVDHIGMYLPGSSPMLQSVTLCLRLIGRLSFPLFLFCMTQGYRHTRSRKKYLFRLYFMNLFMTAVMCLAGSGYGNQDIFLTMFWTGVLISLVELLQRDLKRGCLASGALAAGVWLLGGLESQLFTWYDLGKLPLAELNGDLTAGICLNPTRCEYGITYVLLGVLMYFLWENRSNFMAAYILFALLEFCNADVQFLIVLSLPLILSYNGKRGRGLKWFFYLFYPAHTLLLYWLSLQLAA